MDFCGEYSYYDFPVEYSADEYGHVGERADEKYSPNAKEKADKYMDFLRDFPNFFVMRGHNLPNVL